MNGLHRIYQMMMQTGIALILMFALVVSAAQAESVGVKEENIQFRSGDVTLNGTVLIPDKHGPHPAVVLVHGSNSSNRERYRPEAEIFAKAGIAALIYDKREDGFSKSRAGKRSYRQLAEDVSAAVASLGTRSDIDSRSIGLWGISEGSMVASLAASQPDSNVAFLISVGANGVQPVQQQSWLLVNRLQDQGITSESMIRALTRHSLQFAASAGMFAEAAFDPAQAYEHLQQPVLVIWGSNDRVGPALESYRNIKDALDQSGNDQYTIRFIPNASHLLRFTPDGGNQTDTLAPGYGEAMTRWVEQVIAGHAPKSSVSGPEPIQAHFSQAGIGELAWYNSAWLHSVTALILLFGFGGYLLKSLIRSLKQRGTKQKMITGGRYKRLLAGSAFLTTLGFLAYFVFLMSTGAKNLAPIFLDRTLVWFLLQVSAFTALVSTALLARSLWQSRFTHSGTGRMEAVLVLVGGLLFIPWALYWQLLIP